MNITGEVENAGTTNATYTKISATLYDSDGKVVAGDVSYVNLTALPPGQKSSFDNFYFPWWIGRLWRKAMF